MNEYDCCGVLVHTRPGAAKRLSTTLASLPGVEVHAADRDRLVVTVEGSPGQSCIDTISQLHTIDGVLCASLVYQHTEPQLAQQESAS